MTLGDLSWVMQGSPPIRGVLFLLLGLAWFFPLSYCSKMLKLLCVSLSSWEAPSPVPGMWMHSILLPSAAPAPVPHFLRLPPSTLFFP